MNDLLITIGGWIQNAWPGICAVLALAGLLVLIIRYQVHALLVLVATSLGLGLVAGLSPDATADAITTGIGSILREVALLLALGALLGKLLEVSGAAEVIARRLIDGFGHKNTSLALLLASFLVGIPILFNIGFLVLLPVVYRLQRETGKSLLTYLLPMTFGLSLTHSLVPPHPGIVGAVQTLAAGDRAQAVMIECIVFGSLLCIPVLVIGWFGPGRYWASRQHVEAPDSSSAGASPLGVAPGPSPEKSAKSFAMAVTVVLLPLALSVVGFGADLLHRLGQLPEWVNQPIFDRAEHPVFAVFSHPPIAWMRFFGKPVIAMLAPCALAYWVYGLRSGWSHSKLAKATADSLIEVGGMTFLFGAAGGFKEVLVATGVGPFIANLMLQLPLSPLLTAYVMAVACRIALGSATASILTASALLAGLSASMPGQETYLVLAVASGVTFSTQPADSGFWMVKEYGNLSVPEVLFRFNGCRIVMSLAAIGLILAVHAFAR